MIAAHNFLSIFPILIYFLIAYSLTPNPNYIQPNIVVLLVDNLGWNNVGYHNYNPREYNTPNIVNLLKEGIELDRHYTYKMCSPSRSAFLTGRLPVHVNIYNDDPTMVGQGVPENMTMISDKLTGAGYRSHFVGKWHVGMAKKSKHPPEARGFISSLAYFHSTNNYYSLLRAENCSGIPAIDLWDTGQPATISAEYEEIMLGQRSTQIIKEHDTNKPLFLYHAFHGPCVGWNSTGDAGNEPASLQPEPSYFDKYNYIDNYDRRSHNAMVSLIDDIVGEIVSELVEKNMWDNTLLLWSSDNGGAVHLGGGANSWPLRGGYYNNWEGGIRVPALLAGGILPKEVRGTKLEGFIHIADLVRPPFVI